MNMLTLIGHVVRRDTTRDAACEFRLASNPVIAQRAGGS